VKVIDTDPELLERSAIAALHAAEQTRVHVETEFKDDVAGLMETLVADGPYGYTKMWELQIQPDGSLKVPIATTRAAIFAGYTELHKHTRPFGLVSLIEVRGEWYTFHEGIAGTISKATGKFTEGLTIALFPVGTGTGITGELVWSPRPRAQLGVRANGETDESGQASSDPIEQRRELILQHERYLGALRAAEVEAILEVLSVDGQGAIRDYVHETGTLINLDGQAAHQAYYRSLFDKYEICSVDLLRRVAQDWYVFSELRYTVRSRRSRDQGGAYSFHTAEFFIPGPDGRFVVRIGHGTDPGPIGGDRP
jgi:hypothetical protein